MNLTIPSKICELANCVIVRKDERGLSWSDVHFKCKRLWYVTSYRRTSENEILSCIDCMSVTLHCPKHPLGLLSCVQPTSVIFHCSKHQFGCFYVLYPWLLSCTWLTYIYLDIFTCYTHDCYLVPWLKYIDFATSTCYTHDCYVVPSLKYIHFATSLC